MREDLLRRIVSTLAAVLAVLTLCLWMVEYFSLSIWAALSSTPFLQVYGVIKNGLPIVLNTGVLLLLALLLHYFMRSPSCSKKERNRSIALIGVGVALSMVGAILSTIASLFTSLWILSIAFAFLAHSWIIFFAVALLLARTVTSQYAKTALIVASLLAVALTVSSVPTVVSPTVLAATDGAIFIFKQFAYVLKAVLFGLICLGFKKDFKLESIVGRSKHTKTYTHIKRNEKSYEFRD